jgi:hypothetical protein
MIVHARANVPVTTHQLYASQKHLELVCGFYGMKHPKCKMALEKDDELYKNFILQFDSRNEQGCDLGQSTSAPKRQEMGIRSDSLGGSTHNRVSDSLHVVEEEKE